ncbi:MAG: site-specific integrase, partial [Tannerella sp.]|nr:site-specific integrase [Tannerella sp.]
MDLKASSKDFTVSNVIKKQGGSLAKTTVGDYLESHIKQLEQEKRLKYASTFKELKNSMTAFNTTLNVYFSDIDTVWLKNYEQWLKSKGLNLNSIGVRFRTLRVLYNRAMEENLVRQESYPFKTYKVSKLNMETAKRAITKDEVKRIINFTTDNRFTQLAIDIFYFSYLCAGINFKDIAYLTQSNIVEGQLVYYRKKTKKLIRVPIQDEAMKIIQKY